MVTKAQIEQARKDGRKGWALRNVIRNPYTFGSELYLAWNAGRDEARQEGERPEVKEEVVPVQNAVDLLNLHFKGKK